MNNSDDSMDSASDDAQDDDDPNYTPGRPIDTDKGELVNTCHNGQQQIQLSLTP